MTSKLQVVSFVLLAVGISGCDNSQNATTSPATTEHAVPVTPKSAETNTGGNLTSSTPVSAPVAPATEEATSTTSPKATTPAEVNAIPTVLPSQEDLFDLADAPPESDKDAKGGSQD